jgi:hypothetical protein
MRTNCRYSILMLAAEKGLAYHLWPLNVSARIKQL